MGTAIGAILLSRSGAAEPGFEESIIRRCKNRDADAFALLVDRYQSRVYGFVRRMVRHVDDAEDISQEVFVKAFQNIERFDGRASVSTWLFKIASNLCIDRARRKDRRPEQMQLTTGESDQTEFDLPDSTYDPHDAAVIGEMEKAIEASIASLSEKLKPVLLLHDMEGLSYGEIAGVVGVPVGTVKSRLFLARAHLQAALTKYLATEEIQ